MRLKSPKLKLLRLSTVNEDNSSAPKIISMMQLQGAWNQSLQTLCQICKQVAVCCSEFKARLFSPLATTYPATTACYLTTATPNNPFFLPLTNYTDTFYVIITLRKSQTTTKGMSDLLEFFTSLTIPPETAEAYKTACEEDGCGTLAELQGMRPDTDDLSDMFAMTAEHAALVLGGLNGKRRESHASAAVAMEKLQSGEEVV
jgi:hypothetical protein